MYGKALGTVDNLVHAVSDPRDKPSGSPAKK